MAQEPGSDSGPNHLLLIPPHCRLARLPRPPPLPFPSWGACLYAPSPGTPVLPPHLPGNPACNLVGVKVRPVPRNSITNKSETRPGETRNPRTLTTARR
ncbi:hypothetical protein SKAU_G00302200 [Synaphobranchus kaupii]|uniref:Uncharacterized protein n=1 Tax=Synaphobranchus kaupii TaxID=118154 RepID=A0A9Q1EVW7_SYNKA|nr:hypothetical protein SKAU_G00302200 [Synaphobranchus kaupii]